MNPQIEGDLVLDGLVEGRLPPLPGTEQKLRDWVRFVAAAHLPLNLQIDGGQFSLLPDNAPLRAASVGPDPAEVISSAVEQMLKIFPPGERGKVTSTLRSIEVRPGEHIQTLYAIAPDGSVDCRQRSAPAKTKPRTPPLTRRERWRMRIWAAGAILAILAISSIFIDYRAMWRDYRNHHSPLDAQHITVEFSAFSPFISISSKRLGPDGHGLTLTLERTAAMPASGEQLEAAWRAESSLARRLALESLAKGYARVELFDGRGVYLGTVPIRIQPLLDQPSFDLTIALPQGIRPDRIVITY